MPLRVLYLDYLPRYEYRYLKNALIHDTDLQVKVYLASVQKDWPQEATKGIAPLTPQTLLETLLHPEKLKDYDAVIWGDLDPDRLTQEGKPQEKLARNLVNFVKGGGEGNSLCGRYKLPADHESRIDPIGTPPDHHQGKIAAEKKIRKSRNGSKTSTQNPLRCARCTQKN